MLTISTFAAPSQRGVPVELMPVYPRPVSIEAPCKEREMSVQIWRMNTAWRSANLRQRPNRVILCSFEEPTKLQVYNSRCPSLGALLGQDFDKTNL